MKEKLDDIIFDFFEFFLKKQKQIMYIRNTLSLKESSF